jgi:hypothetical protein
MRNHPPARPGGGAAACTFRRRQRRPEALGGARYAIRYLIAFGGFRGLPWGAGPWQPGQRGDVRGKGASGDRAA